MEIGNADKTKIQGEDLFYGRSPRGTFFILCFGRAAARSPIPSPQGASLLYYEKICRINCKNIHPVAINISFFFYEVAN